jgi:hypothetical protein
VFLFQQIFFDLTKFVGKFIFQEVLEVFEELW